MFGWVVFGKVNNFNKLFKHIGSLATVVLKVRKVLVEWKASLDFGCFGPQIEAHNLIGVLDSY